MNWTLTDTQQRASGYKNETAGVKELSVLTTASRLQKSRLLRNAYVAKEEHGQVQQTLWSICLLSPWVLLTLL